MRELAGLGLVPTATAEVRAHGAAPLFKLYLLNNQEVFFGFYPVVEHEVVVKGQKTAILDVLGKDVPLFHFAANDDDTSDGTQFVTQARAWFESVWSTISREYPA